LGAINVTSALGEPLKAEVELVAEKKEVGSLAVRLATPEAFARAGLTYAAVLTDVKVAIEKRGDGEPYVLITSTKPVDEPFLDLLLELTWASGRVTRQFTALLDPPSLIAERERQKAEEARVKAAPPPAAEPQPEPVPAEQPAPAPEQAVAPTDQVAAPTDTATPTQPSDATTPPAEAQPEAAAAPAESAPVETIGGTAPTLMGPDSAESAASADAYGPVKSGDTLSKIARANKPADVSLEQMLVLMFRNNPEAFSGKNMNRLKTGKILKLPAADEYATLPAADARKEVVLQARDWNAYREQLAEAAGQAAPATEPAEQAAAGKVTSTVEDKGAKGTDAPKEVLKLSKNEPAAGAATAGGGAQSEARVRALEEELVARDKAVKEANDRVARLEKTVKDLQALLELKSKGMSDLQKPATPAPEAKPATPAAPAQPAPPPAAATPPEAKPATPAPEAKPTPPATPAPPTPESATAPPSAQPTPAQPKPKPAPPKPAPLPEPSLVDRVLEQPAYLAAGLGVLILIGALAVRAVKRRRESKADSDDSGPAIVIEAPATAAAMAGAASTAAAAEDSDEVDPVKEAEIFLAYGRDAQAEELLKEALAANPNRQEVRLLLLQIYAKRKDAKSFEAVAREMQQATGGSGPLWEQAVVLGYQIDPQNPRYAAGQSASATAVAAGAGAAAAAENVDFNIGMGDSDGSTTTDIDLGEGGSGLDRTEVIDPTAGPATEDTTVMQAPPVMDFNMDLPPAAAEPAPEPAAEKPSNAGMDFDIDLSSLGTPGGTEPAPAAAPASNGLDFDMSGLSLDMPAEPKIEAPSSAPEIDLSGISLDLGGETAPKVSPSGKDDHWYDVQTKFDLAKAYQEMGDKDGAREILKEVLQEGDAEQKAAAQTVLASLDS
jgi:pilus assembly protein FimV